MHLWTFQVRTRNCMRRGDRRGRRLPTDDDAPVCARREAATGPTLRRVLLIELVNASDRTAATRARREKVALLADLLRRLVGDEVAIGAAFLAGELRQQRAQIGWAALRVADPGAA